MKGRRLGPITVGVDVGGTFIKLGLVRGPKLLYQESFLTAPFSSNPQLLIDRLVEAVRALRQRSPGRLTGVGIGIPGLVGYPQGVVQSCVNLSGWKRVPLKALLRRRLRLPVEVDNDVNLMTLAEWTYGAGKGTSNLICLTLGTGVGGGVVLGGQLYHSRFGPAGEIGHLPLEEKGPRCLCGGRGCLERYVGNREILKSVRAALRRGKISCIPKLIGGDLRNLTPEVIDLACERGDRYAQSVWQRAGERIGLALVQVINLLSPDRIVIGGGIAKASRWLFVPIRKTVRQRAMRGLGGIPIVPAHLGASAGLIGAALLARQKGR